jgi:hypothetical protein
MYSFCVIALRRRNADAVFEDADQQGKIVIKPADTDVLVLAVH